MHGVKRSRAEKSAEQKAAEIEKISKYNKLVAVVLGKKKAKDYSESMLELTQTLLNFNPEFNTLWNYRKLILSHLNEEKRSQLLPSELGFTERMIARHPKSYWCWHHRKWTTQQIGSNLMDWSREIGLTAKLLAADERNFHCWNYRRYIIKSASISDSHELDYSLKLIQVNFSNYSAWHHRSTLLPRTTSSIQSDLALVQQAYYTEPNDQSAWLYHRWLCEHVVEDSVKVLEAEKIKIEELLVIEPEAKWPLLSLVYILNRLNESSNESSKISLHSKTICELLTKLITIDPPHANYYKDFLENFEKK